MAGPPVVDRPTIHSDLERARSEFHALVSRASGTDLARPSDGTRWTNRALLFHMVFGYPVVRALRALSSCSDGFPTAPAGDVYRHPTLHFRLPSSPALRAAQLLSFAG